MLLQHNKYICDINETIIYKDDVFDELIKSISPYAIYKDNYEFLNAIGTTIVNYAPISVNIIDYWNKDIIDSSIYIPPKPADYIIKVLNPFEFLEKDPDNPKDIEGLGFQSDPAITEKTVGGLLVDEKGSIEFSHDDSVCPTNEIESEERFFINSTIGLQDKLAYTHMNNFYITTLRAKQDNLLNQRLRTSLIRMGIIDPALFNNLNSLFDEDSFLTNKHFITKKGTEIGIKYAGKKAYTAEIQGEGTSHGSFFMDIETIAPFEYSIESNLLSSIFESFIKPLAHPIGMGYKYKNVCKDEFANKTEYPLVKITYNEAIVSVDCLCWLVDPMPEDNIPGEEYPLPPEPYEVDCIYGNYPEPKIFATPDGTGLWAGISDDEGTGNILDEYEEGITTHLEFLGQKYKKYTFQNDNYLIAYIEEPNNQNNLNTAKITIRYYRKTTSAYNLAAEFINQRHCNIKLEGDIQKISYIRETMNVNCSDSDTGIFQFLADGETTPPDTPAPSGKYEGFMGTSGGGALRDKLIYQLYMGEFAMLGKDEPIRSDYFSPSGFYECYDLSKLTQEYTIYPKSTELQGA